jgi:methionyl-tRNA formyltransferase
MKIVFFGSSDFSIPALQACMNSRYGVELVVTTPDKKRGRGLKEFPTPVKDFCAQNRLRVQSPTRLSDPAVFEVVKACRPDVFVVSCYGKLIPASWLELPRIARLNVHPSLLPKYRGAAPINWAILNGDTETGVSIIDITDELDAGDIFHQTAVPLDSLQNAEALSARLAELSGRLLRDVLPLAEVGALVRTPQDPVRAVYARKLEKKDGKIRWDLSAVQIHNKVRGLLPWPTAFFGSDRGVPVQVLKSRVAEPDGMSGLPGEVLEVCRSGELSVQTGCGTLVLETVRPAGRKEMTGFEFANGWRLSKGSRLVSA